MYRGLKVEIICIDRDLIDLCISCNNGDFAGFSTIVIGNNYMSKIAEKIRGFPKTIDDTRELIFGSFNPNVLEAGVNLRFYCSDSLGHVELEVTFRTDPTFSGGKSETAEFSLSVEPAEIDRFVSKLLRSPVEVGDSYCLPQAT